MNRQSAWILNKHDHDYTRTLCASDDPDALRAVVDQQVARKNDEGVTVAREGEPIECEWTWNGERLLGREVQRGYKPNGTPITVEIAHYEITCVDWEEAP